jgi:hypothetical protein
VPTYPDPGRPWRIAERLGVNIFHTAPTTIRMLRKLGPDEPKKYNYHFKHMTTVGEPIEPDVWRWYHDVVGEGEAVIVDASLFGCCARSACTAITRSERIRSNRAEARRVRSVSSEADVDLVWPFTAAVGASRAMNSRPQHRLRDHRDVVSMTESTNSREHQAA